VIYSDIIYTKKIGNVYEVGVSFPIRPLPGQFVSLIISGEREIPLSVTDYYDKVLILHLSEKIYEKIKDKKRVLIKGPLGRAIKFEGRKILGIAYKDLFYDILYILREAKRKGYIVKVKCIECFTNEFENGDENDADMIIAAVPKEQISTLPSKALVYVRWVKMNCMLGVCDVCKIGNKLTCIDGPLLKVSEIVDKREGMG